MFIELKSEIVDLDHFSDTIRRFTEPSSPGRFFASPFTPGADEQTSFDNYELNDDVGYEKEPSDDEDASEDERRRSDSYVNHQGDDDDDNEVTVYTVPELLVESIREFVTNFTQLSEAADDTAADESDCIGAPSLPAPPIATFVDLALRHFPKLKESMWLAERLGKALSSRKQYLERRKEHSASQGTIVRPNKRSGETSESHESHVTWLTQISAQDDNLICLLCNETISSENRKSHLRHDSLPYVCIHTLCTSKPFSDVRKWFNHILCSHGARYTCYYCDVSGLQPYELADHLDDRHEVGSTKSATLLRCQRQIFKSVTNECPFCESWSYTRCSCRWKIPLEFRNHLAKHFRVVFESATSSWVDQGLIDAVEVQSALSVAMASSLDDVDNDDRGERGISNSKIFEEESKDPYKSPTGLFSELQNSSSIIVYIQKLQQELQNLMKEVERPNFQDCLQPGKGTHTIDYQIQQLEDIIYKVARMDTRKDNHTDSLKRLFPKTAQQALSRLDEEKYKADIRQDSSLVLTDPGTHNQSRLSDVKNEASLPLHRTRKE